MEKESSPSGARVLHRKTNLVMSSRCQDERGKEMCQNARENAPAGRAGTLSLVINTRNRLYNYNPRLYIH